MPDNRNTRRLDPVPEMPPGFDKLPVEEQMLIKAYKGDAEMMAVYQATKLGQLHVKHEDIETRVISLEESRKKFKWVGGTILSIFGLVKAFILGKLFRVFG